MYNKKILTKSIFIISLLMLLVIFIFTTNCLASPDFPDRTIEIIVGWGAGGGSDLFARTIAKEVEKILDTNIVIINMPGASSSEATNFVQSQAADGYTIFGVTSDVLMNPYLGRTKYDFDSFTPILRAHVDTGMLHTSSESRFKTWEDVVNFAKENPRDLTIGGTGSASFDEIATTVILQSAGIKATFVPFESAGMMHAELLGGHIDLMYDEPAPVMALVESGKLTSLIVATEDRIKYFPDVPSAGELGYKIPPGMWRGMVVKKGTPKEIVKILVDAFYKATLTESYKDFEEGRLLNIRAGYLNSEDFYKVMERETLLYKNVLEELGYTK
jgi:putative tricarboxylic transport membrane protein